jgi:hypothetical protein
MKYLLPFLLLFTSCISPPPSSDYVTKIGDDGVEFYCFPYEDESVTFNPYLDLRRATHLKEAFQIADQFVTYLGYDAYSYSITEPTQYTKDKNLLWYAGFINVYINEGLPKENYHYRIIR